MNLLKIAEVAEQIATIPMLPSGYPMQHFEIGKLGKGSQEHVLRINSGSGVLQVARVAAPEVPDAMLSYFSSLADEWEYGTAGMSFMAQKMKHSAYQKILDMGVDVIPYILRRMKHSPGDWFEMLHELTGANPITARDVGRLLRMTKAWLAWGEKRGLC